MRRFLVLFAFCFLCGGAAHAQSVLVPQEKRSAPSKETDAPPPIVNNGSAYEDIDETPQDAKESAESPDSPSALPPSVDALVRKKKRPSVVAKEPNVSYRKLKEIPYEPVIIDENIDLDPNAPTLRMLMVSLSKNYKFTVTDIHLIKTSLGYTPEEIAQKCRLRVKVKLETSDENDSSYRGYVLAGYQEDIPYNGKLRGLKLRSQALCARPDRPLPKRPLILVRSGDEYGVFLAGQGSCAFGSADADVSSVFLGAGERGGIACFKK